MGVRVPGGDGGRAEQRQGSDRLRPVPERRGGCGVQAQPGRGGCDFSAGPGRHRSGGKPASQPLGALRHARERARMVPGPVRPLRRRHGHRSRRDGVRLDACAARRTLVVLRSKVRGELPFGPALRQKPPRRRATVQLGFPCGGGGALNFCLSTDQGSLDVPAYGVAKGLNRRDCGLQVPERPVRVAVLFTLQGLDLARNYIHTTHTRPKHRHDRSAQKHGNSIGRGYSSVLGPVACVCLCV